MVRTSWCRLSECLAGVVAEVEGDQILEIRANTDAVTGRHGLCSACAESAGARDDSRRLLKPRKREGDRWTEISWETAIEEIGGRLKAIRKEHGATALGIYAGHPVGLDFRATVRTLAMTLGWGTPHLYTPLSTTGGAWVRAGELVLGHPVALQGDVGRAHYVVLLGANQEAQGWGPLQAGRNLPADLAFSRKTKQTKVVAVDSRKTPVAAAADTFLQIRPGTELFFLLGLLHSLLKNNWIDSQFVNDYCTPVESLRNILQPWTIERCAEICGINGPDIQAVALKFSRAAMAVIHRSPQALSGTNGTLTAWALLVAHALTANLLRPGGLYESRGVFDPHPVVARLASSGAPKTRVGNYPLLLLQAPAAILPEEIRFGGGGQCRALLSIEGDPVGDIPGSEALDALDLLVALDVADNATTRKAHYVLPVAHAWERPDSNLQTGAIVPYKVAWRGDALVSPPGEARTTESVLQAIYNAAGATLRGGVHGPHLRALGAFSAGSDLGEWEERLLDQSGVVDSKTLSESPNGWGGAEVDRASWRVTTPSGRIDILPEAIAKVLALLDAPEAPEGYPLRLLTAAARDVALRPFDRAPGVDPGVTLHPSLGFSEGQKVRISTPSGSVETTAHLDATLQKETVDLPAGYQVRVATLADGQRRDPFTGTPELSGRFCRVEAV